MDGTYTLIAPNPGISVDPSYRLDSDKRGSGVVICNAGLMVASDTWMDFGAPIASTMPGIYDVPFNFAFNPAQNVNGWLEFVNMYDYIKLDGVSIKIIPLQNTSNIATTAAGTYNPLPTIQWTYDYDYFSQGAYLTSNVLNQVSTIRSKRLNQVTKLYIKPRMAQEVLQAGANTGVKIARGNEWFDPQDPNTGNRKWTGIRGILRDMSLGQAGTADNINNVIRFEVKYYLTCRKPS